MHISSVKVGGDSSNTRCPRSNRLIHVSAPPDLVSPHIQKLHTSQHPFLHHLLSDCGRGQIPCLPSSTLVSTLRAWSSSSNVTLSHITLCLKALQRLPFHSKEKPCPSDGLEGPLRSTSTLYPGDLFLLPLPHFLLSNLLLLSRTLQAHFHLGSYPLATAHPRPDGRNAHFPDVHLANSLQS